MPLEPKRHFQDDNGNLKSVVIYVHFNDGRKKRLVEMREAAKVAKFGSVIPISGSDFVREVSQAPQDVWVVVMLYKDGYAVLVVTGN